MNPSADVPDFIQKTESYQKGLYEWDKDSVELVALVGFYIGETFVRSFPSQLAWACGDVNFAFENMPVVAGFDHGKELQPMRVANNLLRRATQDPEKVRDFDDAVHVWQESVPRPKE